jgi:hypothetical protein
MAETLSTPAQREFHELERDYRAGIDGDETTGYLVARAVLMLAAEVRELRELVDLRLGQILDRPVGR